MSETSTRITDSDHPPNDAELEEWIGEEAYTFWKNITKLIDQNYPALFSPEWLFGGKNHGWSLRYKKGKSFCTLIPEKGRFALLIVFGEKEREKVEVIRDQLSKNTLKKYDEATTYHDGKWVLLTIHSDRAVKDAMSLLATKRLPKERDSA